MESKEVLQVRQTKFSMLIFSPLEIVPQPASTNHLVVRQSIVGQASRETT
jgi:hypothetical protein